LATFHHLLLNRPAIQPLSNLLKAHPHISELKGLPTQGDLTVTAINASPRKTPAHFTANTATTISASAAALMGKRLRGTTRCWYRSQVAEDGAKPRFCKHCGHDLGKRSERGRQHDGNKEVTRMKCCDCSTVTEMRVYPGATLFCRYYGHVMCDSCRIWGKSGKG